MGADERPKILKRDGQDELAYFYSEGNGAGVDLPCVMFLGGFRSDMAGSKALHLEASCRARGQAYLRFDYSGHGLSQGRFEEGCIGQWRDDARDILDMIVKGPVVLVGSSMGGWIALLLLLERAERVAGVVGIAAAPDFTLSIEGELSTAMRNDLEAKGFAAIPSAYGDPYVITKRLIEDGRKQQVLNRTHRIGAPITLVHGKLDADVPWQVAEAIRTRFVGSRMQIIYIEDGEHRLSRPEDLDLIAREVEAVSKLTL
ncbi:MAG: alpha/beta hydrolase [Alphaproteobacteria bacterium]|nr:alpha/beta hydrolase [Alphaproteobacteria bacterium]MCB9975372.1 alpha/beta hydrolase [Rhodospirillales bacterium]